MESIPMRKDKSTILLVDDDFFNREVMKNIFSKEFSFIEAENGLEGLRKFELYREELCAILTDVSMPVMDGLELLRALHRQGVPGEIPVFLITSLDEADVAQDAYEMGVMDVITKPLTPFVILRRVQTVIELFQAREALSATVQGQQRKLQENAHTIDSLHRGTIEALASAIEFRDVESGEHTKRIYNVTKYILAHTEMGSGLTPQEIENMAVGSIMHDIGKIAISDVILNKPGRLTREEFEAMKQHTVKGAALVEQIPQMQRHASFQYARDIALSHHERWDGRGYPSGLKGDQIPLWAQVVSIADVYDALVSPRVYKRPLPPEQAVEMILMGECGAFNPKLLECFAQVESQLRRWYQFDHAVYEDILEHSDLTESDPDHQEDQPSQELLDVLLLTTAVKSAYDMIICANLTKNSYHMIDYDRFLTHCAANEGVFDDLIISGASTVPPPHQAAFTAAFSRENLIRAHAEGKKSVILEHPQYGDDGQLHLVSTSVLFMDDPRNGDLLQITLARYLDEAHTT